MAQPNWKNRTLFKGDNLAVMRGMNSESVDLIYLDPPFNTNRIFSAPMGSPAAGQSFDDMWGLSEEDEAWLAMIRPKHPAVANVAELAAFTHRTQKLSMKSYLAFMAVRLIEMHRILKPTGSIYLHCDDTANAYLRLIMDAIWGHKNRRNEIVWHRTGGRSDARKYGRVTDRIFFYAAPGYKWNNQFVPHQEGWEESRHPYSDYRGRWRPVTLTGADTRRGESGESWRGFNPGDIGRHWSTPTQGAMSVFIRENGIPDWPHGYPSVLQRLDVLEENGFIHFGRDGMSRPTLKFYAAASRGVALGDVWTDIQNVKGGSKERTGWKTQKPLALLNRIIQASSDEGDIVFDPFCGCATTCVAAEALGRQWVGIDIDEGAQTQVIERLQQAADAGALLGGGVLNDVVLWMHSTDTGRMLTKLRRTDQGGELRGQELKDFLWSLYGRQREKCVGCNKSKDFDSLTMDHIIPQNFGGNTVAENLQLLCLKCNSSKGNRPMEYLLAKNDDIRQKVARQRF